MTPTETSVLMSIAEVEHYRGPDLYLFIGISTAGSSVHGAFPVWAALVAPGSVLRGVDLPEDSSPEQFRRLVRAMRDNPHVHGAVITSHKLRLYRAVDQLLDHVDPLVGITHEINSLDTRNGRISGFARDAQSLDIVLDSTGAGTHTPRPDRAVTCIGAGGSAIALMLAMGLDIHTTMASDRAVLRGESTRRGPLTILGRRQAALDEIRQVQERAGLEHMELALILASDPEQVAQEVRCVAGAVVANATGLGKLAPGSPLSGPEAFPEGALAWDFNYRGPLTFLEQARRASVATEDGWDYFVAGWAAGLAAITGNDLTDELFERFRAASVPLRPNARVIDERAGYRR